ncbi:hypothetical protein [Dickeya oryzae]|uniref:hypothetical protein n=1 Tax=Dickeya oryzae TaxID=1240404 RepID=UPI002096F67F|nr:hypothetical protein [Dickeya oryzae]
MMPLVMMKQETAIKHFEPVKDTNDMVEAVKSDRELRISMAIEQHKTRPESTELNTTLFIRQRTFDQLVNGTYCAEQAAPIGGVPDQIERYIANKDIIAKVSTRKGIDGYTVEEDLVGVAAGNATFKCRYENGAWIMWHYDN